MGRAGSGALLAWMAWLASGCGEDPVAVEDRLWLVEQGDHVLLAVSLADSSCDVHGYLSGSAGPLAFRGDGRLLAVDPDRLWLMELQPSDAQAVDIARLDALSAPRAMTFTPDGSCWILDDDRLFQVDDEAGSWSRGFQLVPDGEWTGLAWLPAAGADPAGDWVPEGALLLWRAQGSRGELAWVELADNQARLHTLLATPELSAMETSAEDRRVLGLTPDGEILDLRPDLQQCVVLRQAGCGPLAATDLALP